LYTHTCLKDRNSKSIEIDLYGKKKEDGILCFALGECKTVESKMKEIFFGLNQRGKGTS
jgi:hypothetical protein